MSTFTWTTEGSPSARRPGDVPASRQGRLAGVIISVCAVATLGACKGGDEGQPRRAPPAPSAAPDAAPDVRHARAVVQRFAAALRDELEAAMAAGGAKHAVAVCNEDAPAIAARIEREPGWSIRRTALKLRNPGNAPDPWERGVLEHFAERQAAGTALEALETFEIVREGDREVFRYMKAIPTAVLCLTCHGSSVERELGDELDRLYPHDQARGFQVGDLRGAFSLRKEL